MDPFLIVGKWFSRQLSRFAEAMDTSEQAVPAVEELFPVQLSMENRFLLPAYFVRDCYPEYVQLVLKRLKQYDIVRITGTPDGKVIGISFGEAYAFIQSVHDAALERKDEVMFLYEAIEPEIP
ncbi:hypothetical protein JG687_00005123 [Phytophthora cactorum]|uniref:Uncharacterized protein n=1 Tax=Phytophthora cactorum TaxID=29920 RepID=A0A8T1ULS1_9STRA|nr:hypothetical protein JG687_00005123 [Phytophthora cactorum]